jgi:hypothetical protein
MCPEPPSLKIFCLVDGDSKRNSKRSSSGSIIRSVDSGFGKPPSRIMFRNASIAENSSSVLEV